MTRASHTGDEGREAPFKLFIVERHFFAKLNGTLQILLLFSLGLRDANVVEYTREFNLFIDSWHCQWTRTSSLARKPFAYAIRWLYYWPSDRPCSIWCLCVASWIRRTSQCGRRPLLMLNAVLLHVSFVSFLRHTFVFEQSLIKIKKG